jgi:hypothetical protein
VEYSYLRKSAPNSDRKDVANIWEISGADELCADFTASENLFLGMRQVSVTSLCFTSQLHKPPPPPTSAWQNSVYQHLWESGRPRADDAFAFARRLEWETCHSGAHLLYITYGENMPHCPATCTARSLLTRDEAQEWRRLDEGDANGS